VELCGIVITVTEVGRRVCSQTAQKLWWQPLDMDWLFFSPFFEGLNVG
jgi:hypothetical protein